MKIVDQENCFGCAACMNACPKRAITMRESEKGFLIPSVDEDKCISCMLCQKVCPALTETACSATEGAFAATLKEEHTLKKCASGGAFAALAQYVLDHNGVVSGCVLDEALMPRHVVVEDRDGLNAIHGSKYVQSDIGFTYTEIKRHLTDGRLVLFSGTPCQVAALHNYLGRDYENLLACDLICHGAPSAKFWKDYICHEEKKLGKRITQVVFRSKKRGWGPLMMELTLDSGKKIHRQSIASSYYYLFLKGCTYRDTCYSCKFSQGNRVGDFTIGDYWGIKEEDPALFDKKGVSVMLFNTPKSLALKKQLEAYIKLTAVDLQKVVRHNKALRTPVDKPTKDYLALWMEEDYGKIEADFLPVKKDMAHRMRVRMLKTGARELLKKLRLYDTYKMRKS